jgi:hypothetical protein
VLAAGAMPPAVQDLGWLRTTNLVDLRRLCTSLPVSSPPRSRICLRARRNDCQKTVTAYHGEFVLKE